MFRRRWIVQNFEQTSAVAGHLNIAALAQRTGIAPDTLRKWEQRYGVLRPSRTEGGQRRYDEADVARVEWLRDRLAEGYRISEAARLLGLGADRPSGTPEELHEALYAAVRDVDPAAVATLLDQAFALYPVDTALSEVIEPVLVRVGEGWASGELTVAQEHLASSAARVRLEQRFADGRGGTRGPAVLACAPGERHELGLLMVAVALSARGWQVAYLGPETPFADALALAARISATTLAVSVTMPESFAALVSELDGISRPRGLRVVVGGQGASPEQVEAAGARYAGPGLRGAVSAINR